MQLVYRAADITEAHIIKGLLESHGISAHVGGFYLQGGVGDLAARDFTNVHVAEQDRQRAMELISEYDGTSRSPDHCTTDKETTAFYKMGLTLFVFILIVAIVSLVIQ